MPANILNLPCYKVRGIQENEHDYHVEVETVESPAACPHCQSANLLSFGWNSCGMGEGFELLEILLVAHGGAHNDTICLAERMIAKQEELYAA